MNRGTSDGLAGRPTFESLEPRLLLDGAPPAPLLVDLQPDSDSGTSQEDNLTNVAAAVIDITAAREGDTVRIFRQGVLLGEAGPVEGALYRFTFAAGQLLEGGNLITARGFDGLEESSDSPALTIVLDRTGPRITGNTPAAPVNLRTTALDAATVTFGEAIDFDPAGTGSFWLEDVAISGPAGPIAPTTIAALGGNSYQAAFTPQTRRGTYTVTVGPNIADLAGNPMDQNADGQPGDGGLLSDKDFVTITVNAEPSSGFPFTKDADWFYLDGRRVFLNILSYQPLEPFQKVADEIRPCRVAKDLQRLRNWTGGSDPVVLRVYAQPTEQYHIRMPKSFYDGVRELGIWIIRDIYFVQGSPGFDMTDFQAGYKRIDDVMAELTAVGGFDRVLAFEIGDEFSERYGSVAQVTTFIEKMTDYIHAYMSAPERQAYSNWVTWGSWPPADILWTGGRVPILPTNLDFYSYNAYSYEPDRIRDQQVGPGTGRPFAGYLAALKEYHRRRQELVGGPAVWDKPVVISETGLPDSDNVDPRHFLYEPWSPWYRKGGVDSQVVCEALAERYWDARLSGCVAGVGIFEWNDEWWKAEPPGQDADFDGVSEECFGLLRFEEDGAGGYQARAKLQYETVRQLFSLRLEDGLVAASAEATSLSPGQTTTLRAEASPELTRPVTYRWEASRGIVVGDGPEVTFRAPDVVLGDAKVTVVVMDVLGRASLVDVAVEIAPPGPPAVTLLTLGVPAQPEVDDRANASGRVRNVDLDSYHVVTFIRTNAQYVQPDEGMRTTWVRPDGYFWTPVHNGASGDLVVYVLPRDRWWPQEGDCFAVLPGSDTAGNDTDNDLLPNWWEEKYSLPPGTPDRWEYPDGDGAGNLVEFLAGTAPTVPDNDSEPTGAPGAVGDGLWDHWEMHFFGTLTYGPGDDPDGDGWDNLLEQERGTNPARCPADHDEDGLPDLWEIRMSGSTDLDPTVRPFLTEYYEVALLEGDGNLDGHVSRTDLLAMKANLGKAEVPWAGGDFDGDGDVDVLDYIALKTNYGRAVGPAEAPGASIGALGAAAEGTLAPAVVASPGIDPAPALRSGDDEAEAPVTATGIAGGALAPCGPAQADGVIELFATASLSRQASGFAGPSGPVDVLGEAIVVPAPSTEAGLPTGPAGRQASWAALASPTPVRTGGAPRRVGNLPASLRTGMPQTVRLDELVRVLDLSPALGLPAGQAEAPIPLAVGLDRLAMAAAVAKLPWRPRLGAGLVVR